MGRRVSGRSNSRRDAIVRILPRRVPVHAARTRCTTFGSITRHPLQSCVLLVRLTSQDVAVPADRMTPPSVEVEVKIAKEEARLGSGPADNRTYRAIRLPGMPMACRLQAEGSAGRFRWSVATRAMHTPSTSLLAGVARASRRRYRDADPRSRRRRMLLSTISDHLRGHNHADADTLKQRAAEVNDLVAKSSRRIAFEREPVRRETMTLGPNTSGVGRMDAPGRPSSPKLARLHHQPDSDAGPRQRCRQPVSLSTALRPVAARSK